MTAPTPAAVEALAAELRARERIIMSRPCRAVPDPLCQQAAAALDAGGCDAIKSNAYPRRERNIINSAVWIYHDSQTGTTYRITPLDLRRARAALEH